jgi:vancomycin resistance protein VanJ
MKGLRLLFAIVVGIYATVLTVILILRVTVGERWELLALIHTGLHLLLIPTLLLLPLTLLLRMPWLALLLLSGMVTFISIYGVQFLPRSIPVPADAMRLSLLTYNLHAEENVVQPMIDVIQQADADIVILQELSGVAAEQIDDALVELYPYRYLHPVSSRYHGRGLLSRFPVTENTVWPEEFPIPVRLQRALIEVYGTPLTIYNMHAPPSFPIWGQPFDPEPRRRQITDLLNMARQDTGAIILAGDFNINDLDENYQHITSSFTDSYRVAGWGMGFTNPDWSYDYSREGSSLIPLHQRLDYVFHNTDLRTTHASVWPESGGSDHRPLYVELILTAS